MSEQEREFWEQIEGMSAVDVFARVFQAAQKARQAAGYVEIPIDVLRAITMNVEELEAAKRALDWMLEGGRMVLCAGKWGEPGAYYMVVGPNGRGPLRVTPLAALQAAMEHTTTDEMPAHLRPRRDSDPSAEVKLERCQRTIAEIETRDSSGESLEQRLGAEEGWLDNYQEIRNLKEEMGDPVEPGCLCGISVRPCPIHGGKS